MPTVFNELRTPDELKLAFPILKELRPELDFKDFLRLYNAARTSNRYTLVGAYFNDECVALLGYRVLNDFTHGQHLYVDDLVTTSGRRGQGFGEELIRYAEARAPRLGCKKLRLCTGNANEGAKKFYARVGWQQRSVVFKKTL